MQLLEYVGNDVVVGTAGSIEESEDNTDFDCVIFSRSHIIGICWVNEIILNHLSKVIEMEEQWEWLILS